MVSDVINNWQHRCASVREMLSFEIEGRISGMTGLTVEVQDFAAPVGSRGNHYLFDGSERKTLR